MADPDRLGTIMGQLAGVSVVCWLMGSASGPTSANLHGPRLETLLERLVDTPVRGFVYEAAGTVEPPLAAGGAAAVRAAAERWRMPAEVVEADPADHARWLAAMGPRWSGCSRSPPLELGAERAPASTSASAARASTIAKRSSTFQPIALASWPRVRGSASASWGSSSPPTRSPSARAPGWAGRPGPARAGPGPAPRPPPARRWPGRAGARGPRSGGSCAGARRGAARRGAPARRRSGRRSAAPRARTSRCRAARPAFAAAPCAPARATRPAPARRCRAASPPPVARRRPGRPARAPCGRARPERAGRRLRVCSPSHREQDRLGGLVPGGAGHDPCGPQDSPRRGPATRAC